MIKEFQAFFILFQKGKELANSATWKNYQNAGNALLGLFGCLITIAGGFGYNIEVDPELLKNVSLGIAAIYGVGNIVLTTITSSKVGFTKSDSN